MDADHSNLSQYSSLILGAILAERFQIVAKLVFKKKAVL